jgi:uncharacterized Fe-S cluster protein YjdI
MPKETIKYSNGEVTVIWKPKVCIHSKICWTELREVFDPFVRPWVKMDGSTTEKIINQVRKCPSGALSYEMNDDANNATEIKSEAATMLNVEISPNGPILIKTSCSIKHIDGTEEVKEGTTALCRCGASSNKPYCDGSHKKIDFKG